LEMIKPEFVDGKSNPIDKETYNATIIFFEKLLKIVHPFMPFITEEIWHLIKNRSEKDCIIVSEWPEVEVNSKKLSDVIPNSIIEDLCRNNPDMKNNPFLSNWQEQQGLKWLLDYSKNIKSAFEPAIKAFEPLNQIFEPVRSIQKTMDSFNHASEVITQIRNIRKEINIPLKENLKLFVIEENNDKTFDDIIMKLSGNTSIKYVTEKPSNSIEFTIKENQYFVPISGKINIEEEKTRIEKELDYNKGFLNSVMKKLSNEKFVSNAKPEIIEMERKKQSDTEAKIKSLEEQLVSLK
ncbi:MAG TPA: class I tRNA ligase family protein, partial [Bacteroidia bacterium]|nr:class I tRNA ligase family protein [Bacteroidia bacterium]